MMETPLIVFRVLRLLCVRSVDVMTSSHLFFFSSVMVFTNLLPTSLVESLKGLLENCFLYGSYRLCDSFVRPGMKWVLHSIGICLLDYVVLTGI